MKLVTAGAPRRTQTLQQVLSRAHLGVAVIAVSLAGLAMIVVGLLALRAYADHNLQLIARSMAYTVEAAVVFRDPAAAAEGVALIASAEDISEARVSRIDDGVLAEWRLPPNGSFHAFEDALARLILPGVVSQAITQGGIEIGRVEVSGHGSALLRFLVSGLAGLLICLGASAAAAIYLSRRLVGQITHPLRDLAAVAHAVRYDHDLGQRVKPAGIAELNELGQDFNMVLNGFEAWHRYLENAYTSMAHRATHDSLTGLHNRAHFEARMEMAVRDAKERGYALALLYVDANGFKQINDGLGHAAGDVVLSTIAERLRAQVRASDLVGRMGGDEFAVLLPSLEDGGHALRVREGLQASMAVPIGLPTGTSVQASVSVGIAMLPDDGTTLQELMASADAAMYRAKAIHKIGTRQAASLEVLTPEGSS